MTVLGNKKWDQNHQISTYTPSGVESTAEISRELGVATEGGKRLNIDCSATLYVASRARSNLQRQV